MSASSTEAADVLAARIQELEKEKERLLAVVDILGEISDTLHFVDILQAIARKLRVANLHEANEPDAAVIGARVSLSFSNFAPMADSSTPAAERAVRRATPDPGATPVH